MALEERGMSKLESDITLRTNHACRKSLICVGRRPMRFPTCRNLIPYHWDLCGTTQGTGTHHLQLTDTAQTPEPRRYLVYLGDGQLAQYSANECITMSSVARPDLLLRICIWSSIRGNSSLNRVQR